MRFSYDQIIIKFTRLQVIISKKFYALCDMNFNDLNII